jgi:hypothetical protein
LRIRLLSFALALGLLSTAFAAPAASAAPANPLTNIPVTGTVQNGGTFVGNLNITSFAARSGQLVANGTLSGTLKDAGGNTLGTVTNQAVTLPVAASGSCQVLNLTLGPLDLNLLGLMVHLNQVVLDITAQQAPGNLLGNLLCIVANLLNNSSASPNAIAQLLNQILRAL